MSNYVHRNGERLTPYMLQQIERFNTDFKSAFGYEIIVSSGIRLHQEQIDIFLSRYVTAGNVNGRPVYDTRVWNGVRYYRISSAGTVAVPGTSNHEIQGNVAAVDLRDTGSNAGITVAGSQRANWARANAYKYDLVASGYGFGEPWHFDVKNIWSGTSSGIPSTGDPWLADIQNYLKIHGYYKGVVDGLSGPLTTQAIKNYQSYLQSRGWYSGAIDGIWGNGTQSGHDRRKAELNAPAKPSANNPFGIAYCAGLQKIARFGGYKGPIDQIWGAGSAAGFAQWLRANWGYRGNDVLGPVMWSAIARWLRSRWGYVGNDVPGPVMRAALQKAETANYHEL